MVTVRIEHATPDYARWKHVFDHEPADRRGSGVLRYRIHRALDDANYVFIDLDFDLAPHAEAFLHKMNALWDGPGKSVIQSPRARILEAVEAIEL